MNTVIVPLFRRPEYFKIWVEILKKADEADKQFYIFCLDWGFDNFHMRLIHEFPYAYGTILTPKTNYKLTKQSFNVLNGLMVGAKHSDGLVYYIEEDVFIGKDFFRFHEEVHRQQKDIFCSIGTRNNNSKYYTDGYLDHYYLSFNGDYQSLGSCFKASVINEMIGPHFTDLYFRDPVGYCKLKFPASKIGPFFVEQDGLIRRVLELSGKSTAFPHVPRAFHGGIYGYNRKDIGFNRLSFSEKVEKIKDIAFSKEKLKKYVQHPEYYYDSEPCDLDTNFVELINVNTKLI